MASSFERMNELTPETFAGRNGMDTKEYIEALQANVKLLDIAIERPESFFFLIASGALSPFLSWAAVGCETKEDFDILVAKLLSEIVQGAKASWERNKELRNV